MVSKFNRSLLATLVLGLAVTTSNARAEAAAAAGAADASAALNSYNCLADVCVGMTVRIVGGYYAGHAGQVIAIDEYQDEITVVNSSGYTLVARSYDVIADMSQPSTSGCVSNICIGDQVRVLIGAYAGRIGTVVDADEYNYTATILIGGRYVIEDVRDLTLSLRPAVIHPYPNYPRNCAMNYYVYDIYRGCVRITYSYPRPYIHAHPRHRPMPRSYPQPRRMPNPPRTYPQPRGPMPHPRGTMNPPRGPNQPRHNGQGPRGNPNGPGRRN